MAATSADQNRNCWNLAVWEYEIAWDLMSADFTGCIHKPILVWIPCCFLWLTIPFELHCLQTCKMCPNSIRGGMLKLINSAVLVFLTLLDTLNHSILYWKKSILVTELASSTIKSLTMAIAFSFIKAKKERNMIAKTILFVFWFLQVVSQVVIYRSLLYGSMVYTQFSFFLLAVSFPLTVTQMILFALPEDNVKRDEDRGFHQPPCPEGTASLFSRILFSWVNSLMLKGYKRPLTSGDLWALDLRNTSVEISRRFDRQWNKEKENRGPRASILKTIGLAFGRDFLFYAFLKLICDLLVFGNPLLLRRMIKFVTSDEPNWHGYYYSSIMFGAALLQSLMTNQHYHLMQYVGTRVKTALVLTIYRKALRITVAVRKTMPLGEIINLMAVDSQQVVDMVVEIGFHWSAPIQLGIAIFLLWRMLGLAALSGLLVMIFFIPLNTFIASIIKKKQAKMMKFRDLRLKTTNEVMSGVKVLKLNAWEMSFYHIITNIRNRELKEMVKIAYVRAVMVFLFQITPVLVTLATFGTYVLNDPHHTLDATKVFVSLSLLHVMRAPLNSLPTVIMLCIQGSVALRRIGEFLRADEVNPNDVEHSDLGDAVVVTEDATFSWGRDEPPAVTNLNFQVLSGQLVVLVGPVGSGKSTLLAALLGELNKLSGLVNTTGSIAYVPQQAWIKNSTLQKNILFGKPMNEEYYDQVLYACALYPDLEILPGRDYTEIGEKGVNVSGGQKQRVSLARAVYSDSDIYLLDDPLSAVDSNVGQHILDHVIGAHGLLNKKTRILATHGIASLPIADIIVVMTDGRISESGTFSQLLRGRGAFSEFLITYLRPKNFVSDVDMQKREETKDQLLLNIVDKETKREMTNILANVEVPPAWSTPKNFYQKCQSFQSYFRGDTDVSQLPHSDDKYPLRPEEAEGSRSTQDVLRLHNVSLYDNKNSTSGSSLEYNNCNSKISDYVREHCGMHQRVKYVSTEFAFGGVFKYWEAKDLTTDRKSSEQNRRLPAGVERLAHFASQTGSWQHLSTEQFYFLGGAYEERYEEVLSSAASNPVLYGPSSRDEVTKHLSPSELEERSKLISEEGAETGVVRWGVYFYYIRALSSMVCVISLMLFLASEGCSASGNIWLSKWSSDKPLEDGVQDLHLRNYRLFVFAMLGVGQALFMLLGTLVLTYGTLRASQLLHQNLLLNVMRSPMEFFDVSPVGRLMNRFSKDMEGVDESVPRPLRPLLTHTVHLVATVVIISQNIPAFIIITPFLLMLYFFIQKFYLRTARQLKRLEAISRSPIYAHFSETVSGLTTIRAYHQQEMFIQEAQSAIDLNQTLTYPRIAVKRWLAVRLDFIGNIIVLSAGSFVAYQRNTMDPGVVGLVINYALQVTHLLSGLVRLAGDWENSVVAVERIKEYSETPQEVSWEIAEYMPPKDWPQEGCIVFDNFSLRYREKLEPALKDINIKIHGGEKVGIVGRTGAGKTSMTLALFRIIEPYRGTIYIDDVDIRNLGLHDLRSKLTIIPQEPVLFSGSLRMNLDPLAQYDEDEMLAVLRQANLSEFISSASNGLEFEITENGDNLSVGQQQLICLARALLRKTKVLVLDEATAAIDFETDVHIQETIRQEFASCTIVTIAHRINTILDYNRILVLANGEVKEFDTPANLLADDDSMFYNMAKEAGVLKTN